MKKQLLVVLALSASVAHADNNYVKLSGEYRNADHGAQDSETVGIVVGKNINSNLDAELHVRIKSNDDDTNSTRVEGALIGKYPLLTGLSLYSRGAVGDNFNGNDDNPYWSVEPGIKYTVNQDLSVKAGLRFRDAFSNDNDSTRTYRLGAEYVLFKTSSLSLGYDRSYGDSEYDSINFGYNINY